MNKENNIIKVLSADVVAKIAAGEVIEKPASVVKELIENSIDAGSTQITLRITDAGLSLIEVTDDGVGMSRTDAELAFAAHSTSKISSIDDLNTLITLGFRGEALASIAAVADIEMNTTNGIEKTNIQINNGKFTTSKSEISKGTDIKVKMLFSRVPARKKFLRSEATEYKHIQDIFLRHAIINPQIHFKLISNNKEIYNLPKATDLKTRIFDIWGAKIAKNTQIVTYDAPDMQINGLIGHPELARRDRSMQFLFLNNRPIESNLIGKAVEDAFHATKPEGFNPIFFINLAIDPKEVDVNVHPRKMEVKFGNTGKIFSTVKHTIDKHLADLLQEGVKHHFTDAEASYLDKKDKPKSFTLGEPKVSYGETPSQSMQNSAQNHPGYNGKQRAFKTSAQFPTRNNKDLIAQSLAFNQMMSEKPEQENGNTLETMTNKVVPIAKQFFETFIVVQREGKLLFIDQHAADERIKYEKLLKHVKDKEPIPIQQLLVPQTMELSQAEYDLFLENKAIFDAIGLEIEPFGQKTIKLNAIPSVFEKLDFQKFIEEILNKELVEIDKDKVLYEFIATMACHGSIRAGRKLQQVEVEKLISDLFESEKPYSCPHGRPIIWEMSKYEIEKKFKRTGFC